MHALCMHKVNSVFVFRFSVYTATGIISVCTILYCMVWRGGGGGGYCFSKEYRNSKTLMLT